MNSVDLLHLKAALLVEGIDYSAAALAEVGSTYKEQNHGLFGWDFVTHKGIPMPDDFLLSDGKVAQFRYRPSSPFRVEAWEEGLALTREGEKLDQPCLLSRPNFYDRPTQTGYPMRRVAQVGGADCFFVCYQNFCSHFASGQQCAFCNLVATKKAYNEVLSRKDVNDIAEAASAAFAEGSVEHILLTGGCTDSAQEVSQVCAVVESIRAALGTETVPGTILPSATTREDDMRRYRDTGIGALGYSMEIWDEPTYQAICPGKASSVSHDEFFKAIRTAVRIFGPGNVYGVLVMGLEPKDTFLEGIRALSEVGANVVPFVWSPNPGSRLAGHRAPTAEWYTDTIREAAEIVAEAGVPRSDRNHCYRCDGNSLLHDALRELDGEGERDRGNEISAIQ